MISEDIINRIIKEQNKRKTKSHALEEAEEMYKMFGTESLKSILSFYQQESMSKFTLTSKNFFELPLLEELTGSIIFGYLEVDEDEEDTFSSNRYYLT